jgi:hypothetical protein
MNSFDPASVTHIITDPFGPNPVTVVPSPETLRELEAAFDDALLVLDEERPWQPCDDFPVDESGVFRLG